MKIKSPLFALSYLLINTIPTNAQWQQIGLSGRDVLCLASNNSNIFAGTGNGWGLFTSIDNGKMWFKPDSAYTFTSDVSISSLAVNGDTIYFGTSYFTGSSITPWGGAFYISIDNGVNFICSNYSSEPPVNSILKSGTNLYVGTGSNGLDGGWLDVSRDNGTNWNEIGIGLPNTTAITGLAISGINIFAASEFYGVFFSTDTGNNFTNINNGLIDSMVSALTLKDSIIIIGTNSIFGGSNGGVFMSNNNGASWLSMNNALPDSTNITAFACNDSNIIAGTGNGLEPYAHGKGVYLSTDNGLHWRKANYGFTDTTIDINALLIKDSTIFAATNNGVWRRSLMDILGIESFTSDDDILTVYPNPSVSGKFHLSLNAKGKTSKDIFIYNVVGKQVYQNLKTYKSDLDIDLSTSTKGVYLVKALSEGKVSVSRVVVM